MRAGDGYLYQRACELCTKDRFCASRRWTMIERVGPRHLQPDDGEASHATPFPTAAFATREGLAMNALDLLLTSSELPACDACRHARASADGLYCARRAGAPYPCQIERGSALVEAWLYGACGRHGRFFEAAAAATAGGRAAGPLARALQRLQSDSTKGAVRCARSF
jgi:hypothetical protein